MNLDEFLKFWEDLKAAYEEEYDEEFSSADDILAEYGVRKILPNYRENSKIVVALQAMNAPANIANRVNDLMYEKRLVCTVNGNDRIDIKALDDVLDGIYNEWNDRILKNGGEEARRKYNESAGKRRTGVMAEKSKIKQEEERQRAEKEKEEQLRKQEEAKKEAELRKQKEAEEEKERKRQEKVEEERAWRENKEKEARRKQEEKEKKALLEKEAEKEAERLNREKAEQERLNEKFNMKVETRLSKEITSDELQKRANELSERLEQETNKVTGNAEKYLQEISNKFADLSFFTAGSDLEYAIYSFDELCKEISAGSVPDTKSEDEYKVKVNQVFDFLQDVLDTGAYKDRSFSTLYTEFTKKRAESLDENTIKAIKEEIEEEELENKQANEVKNSDEKVVEAKVAEENLTENKIQEEKKTSLENSENNPGSNKGDSKKVLKGMLEKLKEKRKQFANLVQTQNKDQKPEEKANQQADIEEKSEEKANQQAEVEAKPEENANQQVEVEAKPEEKANQQVEVEAKPEEKANQQVEVEAKPEEKIEQQPAVEEELDENIIQQPKAEEQADEEEIHEEPIDWRHEGRYEEWQKQQRDKILNEALEDFNAISGKSLGWHMTGANAETFKNIKECADVYDSPIWSHVPEAEKRENLYRACDKYLRAHTADGRTIDGQNTKTGRLRKQAVLGMIRALELYPDVQRVKARMDEEAFQASANGGKQPTRVRLNYIELEKSLAGASKLGPKLSREDKLNPDKINRKAFSELKEERVKAELNRNR